MSEPFPFKTLIDAAVTAGELRPGDADYVYQLYLGSADCPRHSQYTKSLKPGHIWKRRKNELKRLAFANCQTCGGRGYIVGVPSSGIRAAECACTKGN